jgi:hypothetical protein
MDVKSLYVVGMVACYSGKGVISERYESGKVVREGMKEAKSLRD